MSDCVPADPFIARRSAESAPEKKQPGPTAREREHWLKSRVAWPAAPSKPKSRGTRVCGGLWPRPMRVPPMRKFLAVRNRFAFGTHSLLR